MYSPLTSLKGATLAVTKAPKERAADDFATSTSLDRPIITPHSLPMFKDDYGDPSAGGRGGKRKRERERHDPQKTMKPSASLPILWIRRKLTGRACSASRRRTRKGWTYRSRRDAARRAGTRARRSANAGRTPFLLCRTCKLFANILTPAARSAAQVRDRLGRRQRVDERVDKDAAEAGV